MMKRRRIKVSAGEAVYHCMSRVVCEAPFWDERAREVMRRQLWASADFSGVRILTYCIMSNHFHVLVQIPDRKKIVLSDQELLRRYKSLYPEPTPFEAVRAETLEEILQNNGPQADALRQRLLARMHDVSEFMKTFKQRFSVWYNRSHDRHGTLWSERFRSVLVEGTPLAARTVAAYIDLNPVRAGLVQDPKDYRWCGYAEAVAGKKEAREGIAGVCGPVDPRISPDNETFGPNRLADAMDDYRTLLFGKGAAAAPGKANAACISPEAAAEVLKKGGKLPAHLLLRCRMRYFTHGLILGSHDYVQAQLEERFRRGEIRRKREPEHIPPEEWEDLAVARRVK